MTDTNLTPTVRASTLSGATPTRTQNILPVAAATSVALSGKQGWGTLTALATVTCTIAQASFTDLGAAPVMVQCLGPGPVRIAVSDTAPASSDAAFVLTASMRETIFDPADASAHVWAAAFDSASVTIAYSYVEAQ